MVLPFIFLYLLTLTAPLAVVHVSLWLVYDTVLHAPAFEVDSVLQNFNWSAYLARGIAVPELAAAVADFVFTVVMAQIIQAWVWSAKPDRPWVKPSLLKGGIAGFIAGALYGVGWSLIVIFRCDDAFTSAVFAHHADAYVWWPLMGGFQGAAIGLGAAWGLIRFAQDVARNAKTAER